MLYLVIGTVCLLLFFVLLHRDPRSFANVIVLLAAAVLLFIGTAEAGQHVEYISSGAVLFLFGFVPLSLLFIAVLLILNGFFMLKREGRRLANLLSMLAGFAIIAGLIATVSMVVASTPNTMLMSVLWLGSILTVYVSATFTAFLIYSLLYLKLPKDMHCDYIIVHGCGLLDGDRVSPLLKGRIDRAVQVYRKLDGRAKLVLSGGQGPDETIMFSAPACLPGIWA
jgi:hypothetical protein